VIEEHDDESEEDSELIFDNNLDRREAKAKG
jgi:hypothetical protein